MASNKARIEVLPTLESQDQPGPVTRRPHLVQLRGANGRLLLVSPHPYGTRFHALRAVDSVVEAAKQVLHHDALGVTWPSAPPKVVVLDGDGKEVPQ